MAAQLKYIDNRQVMLHILLQEEMPDMAIDWNDPTLICTAVHSHTCALRKIKRSVLHQNVLSFLLALLNEKALKRSKNAYCDIF